MVVLPLRNTPAALLLAPRVLLLAILLPATSNSNNGSTSDCTDPGKSSGTPVNPFLARVRSGVSGVIEILLALHPKVSSLLVVGFKKVVSPSVSALPGELIKIGRGSVDARVKEP